MIPQEYNGEYIELIDVTKKCIEKLNNIPASRTNEPKVFIPIITKHGVDEKGNPIFDIDTSITESFSVHNFDEKTIIKPATIDRWVLNDSIYDSNNRLFFEFKKQISSNYECKIFKYKTDETDELILVCYPTIEIKNFIPDSFPFVFYIPPVPQDDPKSFRKRTGELYKDVADADLPIFYNDKEDKEAYPFKWDWLYFQFYSNIDKFVYQMPDKTQIYDDFKSRFNLINLDNYNANITDGSKYPTILVIPLIKNNSGINYFLDKSSNIEKCLQTIQKKIFDAQNKKFLPLDYPKITDVSIMAFSNGHHVLRQVMKKNKHSWASFGSFISQIISFDPDTTNRIFQDDDIKYILKSVKLKLFTQKKQFWGDVDIKYLNTKGKILKDGKHFFVFTPESPARTWEILSKVSGYYDIHNTIPKYFFKIALEN